MRGLHLRSLAGYWQHRRIRKLVRRGNAARDIRNWAEAAATYEKVCRLCPTRADIHVQLGHALKELGSREDAEASYRRALASQPENADTWLQLGHVLKLLARIEDAEDAYCQALVIAPDFEPAKGELIALGSAHKLLMLDIGVEPALRQSDVGFPLRDYDAFRQRYNVPIPSSILGEFWINVWIDARRTAAANLRVTIESIRLQTHPFWNLTVWVDDSLAENSIASIVHSEPRIRFTTVNPHESECGRTLLVQPGVALEASAIAWFAVAASDRNCRACYCDHDLAIQKWRGPKIYGSPILQPSFDSDWFDDAGTSPVFILIADPPCDWFRLPLSHLLSEVDGLGSVFHLPLLLASVVDLVSEVVDAPGSLAERRPKPPALILSAASGEARRNRISVIIPTRDQFVLLEHAISTLAVKAEYPELLDIVVVDNRSSDEEAAAQFRTLQERHGARVIRMDEPFNWSRANNLAAADGSAEILIFMNNDMEMLSEAWDDRVRMQLQREAVGILGARLLYPDRTLQHGGIVFGFGRGAPMHEGVGVAEDNAGPNGRWLRSRSTGAVTGAFMAMRRSVWGRVGGFDEANFPLGYNDVDMCLKSRAAGFRVIYDPAICLTHFESKTRGLNVSKAQVAWDNVELRALSEKWGRALFVDGSANLHWSRDSPPFESLRLPSRAAIDDYLSWQSQRSLGGMLLDAGYD